MTRRGITVLLLVHVLFANDHTLGTCSVIAFQREFRPSRWPARPWALSASRRGRRARQAGSKTNTDQRAKNTKPEKEVPKTKKVTITLENNESVVLAQVDDDQWWNRNDNPYGAKPWPAAYQTANILTQHKHNIRNKTLVELGCGTALVSIVAAAMNGANVIATDISPLTLSLCKEGWKKTTSRTNDSIKGSLETRIFDIASNERLPIPNDTQAIVVATAMLYQPQLAQALARRVAEAFQMGAWIIIGDDDTGNIARDSFETELKTLLGDEILSDDGWIKTTVKCPELGWTQKNVRILQLNSPIE
mmetsp:Transcript_6025/g.13115  ORF Transcript_6025/g.13115 Transcript_6025/m.13115 type:complete len:305 (+) Transcript_6025:114-1028(+)|eukprot:CAMPEP_0178487568 /NCGR_PEP_ID=MMETSP0696-20121128/9390_1 /TAXON_ID=265572 /ORGANISM="Extubocellulus spinifer, Strain CCMP396" /LENGTH=304 /DNA_ID=CAMNT_0020115267 /DNA_START=23 /DNA_END=937 /DNA_ORIENTATION=+